MKTASRVQFFMLALKQTLGPMRFLFFLFLAFSSHAQIVQTNRFERTQKGSDEYFTIVSLKDEGLALVREKNKFFEGNQKWDVIVLDTALTIRHESEIDIKNRHPFIGYEYVPGYLYLLYRDGETTRNNFELIEFDLAAGSEKNRYIIKPELDLKLTHFSKVGNNIVLGGYVSNEPAVLLFAMATKVITVVPGFFQKDNELVELRVNQNQTFNTLIVDRSTRSERKLVFRTFDETGKLLLEDVIPIDDDRTLQTSISSSLIREDLLVLGTWGDRQGKQSQGFFSLPIDPFSEQKINYFYFGELDHFMDYMSPKRAARQKEKTREDILKNEKPSFTAHVMPYKIEEHPEGYILLAEVYHPTSSTNPYYNSPYNSAYYNSPYYYYNPFWPGYYPGMRMYRPYSYGSNVRNADEIKTYESLVVAFDPKGNRLWDQSIKVDEIKKPALDQLSDYFYDKSSVYFMYKKESELLTKTISLTDGSAKESSQKIRLSDPVDEIRSENEYEDGIKHWNGNSFYMWGYHSIRNTHKDERVRDVFYINKVVVR
jgi:hypothetical protein